jgi:hypothetical protein
MQSGKLHQSIAAISDISGNIHRNVPRETFLVLSIYKEMAFIGGKENGKRLSCFIAAIAILERRWRMFHAEHFIRRKCDLHVSFLVDPESRLRFPRTQRSARFLAPLPKCSTRNTFAPLGSKATLPFLADVAAFSSRLPQFGVGHPAAES